VDPTEKALPFPRNVWNAKRSIVATEIAKQFPSILGICFANSVKWKVILSLQ